LGGAANARFVNEFDSAAPAIPAALVSRNRRLVHFEMHQSPAMKGGMPR